MISSEIDIDGILTRLQGRKGRAFDEAWYELEKLAETVDAVRQPEIKRQNEEAKRNAVPGQPVRLNCEPPWVFCIGPYVQSMRNKRETADFRDGAKAGLKRMAAYAMELAIK